MLIRQNPHLYEIRTAHFVMRIRFETGAHRKSINATLIPASEMPGDIEKGGHGELGVVVVAGYNGLPIDYIPWAQTEEGLFEEAQYRANMAREYGLPYLLGQKSDWERVKEYINEKIEERSKEIRKFKFPPNVQKRWHLPPEFPKKEE